MSQTIATRSTASIWIQAVRPFAFSASVVPVLLGTAFAYFVTGEFSAIWFVLAMVGGVLLHSGANLMSDYYDFKKGADTPTTYGGSRVLVEELISPARLLRGAWFCFGLAFAVGIVLVSQFGWTIVVLGLAGLAGGLFYTAGPVHFKYRALGEPFVFTLFGPLMVLGAYFVQTSQLSWIPVIIAVPPSLLVAGILNANNWRDIRDDASAGFKTIPGQMSWKGARMLYHGIIISAYVLLVVTVALKLVPVWGLLSLITLIPSLKLHKIASAAKQFVPADIATLDVATAQLHMQYGLLMTIGVVVARFMQ